MVPIICLPYCYLSLLQKLHSTTSLETSYSNPNSQKASKSEVSNYHPISLTSVPCKVFEYIINQAITRHLRSSGVLSNAQYSFQAGWSMVLQLLLAANEWVEALDKGNLVDIAYLDFARAFDSVSHQKLIHILDQISLHGNVLTWIRNYLTGRSQRVKIDNRFSSSIPVISSTPQGTVLGPLLFLIYINELPTRVKHCSIHLFADDCKIHFAFPCAAMISALQDDLNAILDWSNAMQLTLSVEKCSIPHLASQKQTQNFSNSLGKIDIKTESMVHDLGVLISSNLKWIPGQKVEENWLS